MNHKIYLFQDVEKERERQMMLDQRKGKKTIISQVKRDQELRDRKYIQKLKEEM